MQRKYFSFEYLENTNITSSKMSRTMTKSDVLKLILTLSIWVTVYIWLVDRSVSKKNHSGTLLRHPATYHRLENTTGKLITTTNTKLMSQVAQTSTTSSLSSSSLSSTAAAAAAATTTATTVLAAAATTMITPATTTASSTTPTTTATTPRSSTTTPTTELAATTTTPTASTTAAAAATTTTTTTTTMITPATAPASTTTTTTTTMITATTPASSTPPPTATANAASATANTATTATVIITPAVAVLSSSSPQKTTKSHMPMSKLTTIVGPLARSDNCSSCFSHNFAFIHVNKKICEYEASNIDIIILISTTHGNKFKREVIRKTWMSISTNNTSNVRYVFLLGSQSNRKVNKETAVEFDKYKDIVQEDFIDTYTNLTLKTLMGFKWASLYCSSAKFVMKTDDDMYVNVTNLLTTVRVHQKKLESSVGGMCKYVAYPIRDSRSKWHASVNQYPRAKYPGYCSGTGYVTTMAVMQKVFEVSKHVPFFHLEDVYVALCIERLGYSLTNLEGFSAARWPLDSCVYKGNQMITSHGLSTQDMLIMFTSDCIKNQTKTNQ